MALTEGDHYSTVFTQHKYHDGNRDPKSTILYGKRRFMEIKERGQRGLSRLKAGKLNSDPGGDVEPSQNLSSRGPTPLMRTKGRMPTLYAGISPGEGVTSLNLQENYSKYLEDPSLFKKIKGRSWGCRHWNCGHKNFLHHCKNDEITFHHKNHNSKMMATRPIRKTPQTERK